MRNGDQRRMSVPLCAALLRLRFRALSTVASLMKRVGGHTRCLSRPPLPACPVAGALATHARCCIATASPCHRHTCVGVGLRRSERDAVPPSDESRTLGWLTW